jgi:hypothetical protein
MRDLRAPHMSATHIKEAAARKAKELVATHSSCKVEMIVVKATIPDHLRPKAQPQQAGYKPQGR